LGNIPTFNFFKNYFLEYFYEKNSGKIHGGVSRKNFILEKLKFILNSKLNLLKFRKSTTDFLKFFFKLYFPLFSKIFFIFKKFEKILLGGKLV
jgi:hypothetical protein